MHGVTILNLHTCCEHVQIITFIHRLIYHIQTAPMDMGQWHNTCRSTASGAQTGSLLTPNSGRVLPTLIGYHSTPNWGWTENKANTHCTEKSTKHGIAHCSMPGLSLHKLRAAWLQLRLKTNMSI